MEWLAKPAIVGARRTFLLLVEQIRDDIFSRSSVFEYINGFYDFISGDFSFKFAQLFGRLWEFGRCEELISCFFVHRFLRIELASQFVIFCSYFGWVVRFSSVTVVTSNKKGFEDCVCWVYLVAHISVWLSLFTLFLELSLCFFFCFVIKNSIQLFLSLLFAGFTEFDRLLKLQEGEVYQFGFPFLFSQTWL
jgi:hypothetical protein